MSGANINGYAKLQSVLQLMGAVGAILGLYISLSVAPMRDAIEQSKQDIKDLRAVVVPRAEHDRDWASQDRQFSDLQRQIDQNREDIKSIFTPSDALKQLNDRVAKLEDKK